MTESKAHETTKSSLQKTPRSLWLKQQKEERQLWIAQHQIIGRITLTGVTVQKNNGWLIEYVCDCGNKGWSTRSGLQKSIGNKNRACKACARRIRNIQEGDELIARLRKQSEKVAGHPLCKNAEEREVLKIMVNAKLRCTSKRPIYANWNGRGIKFLFSTPYEAMRWIIDNLGPRPSKQHSIDRIDNDRHYEAGNLRWATRSEQNSNKRAYKVGPTGDRIRRLQLKCNYRYESIRSFIKQGLSDEEIINRKKWDGCGKYKSTSV